MGDPDEEQSKRRSRRTGAALLVVVAVPLLTAMVVAVTGNDLPPNDDVALIELRTSDVGAHTPLVGSYERFGGNQPGPLLFYLLAAPYRLVGSDFRGLSLGALAITLACVVITLTLALRRGGLALALWTALLVELLLLGRGVPSLLSPWEPLVSLAVFVLLLFLVWELACGTAWALPGIAAAASFLAQVWIAYGLVVVSLGLFATLILTARLFGGDPSRPKWSDLRWPVVATIAVLGTLWFAPFLEQVTERPGNVNELAAIRHADGPRVGVVDGYRAVAIEFDIWAPWLGDSIPTPALSPTVDFDAAGPVPVALVLFGAASVMAWRRRAMDAVWLDLAVATAVVATIVSKALVVDELFVWIVEPDRVVGMACWLAAGYSLARSLPARHVRSAGPFMVAILGVAVVGAAALLTGRVVADPPDPGPVAEAVANLAERVLSDPDVVADPVLVTSEATLDERGSQPCCRPVLAALLARAGVDVVVDEAAEHRYGSHRADPSSARTELLLASLGDGVGTERKGYELVGVEDPLTPNQRARRASILRRLAELVGPEPTLEQIDAARRADGEVVRLYRALAEIPEHPRLALYRRELGGEQ